MARDIFAIVPAYRNPEQLARCMAHLAVQTVAPRLEAFVRDNSTDNVLYTAAINEGLRRGLARADVRYFLLLNQDCYLAPGAVEALVAHFDADPRAGICAPLQIDASNPSVAAWAGSHAAYPAGAHFGGPLHLFTQPAETAWANGAAMMVRRAVVEEIGLLDANMRMVCSDSDYSFSARARGWKVVVVPAARCEHASGASRPGGAAPDIEAIKQRDVDYFADKWFTGLLYRRLAADGPTIDLDALRRMRERDPR